MLLSGFVYALKCGLILVVLFAAYRLLFNKNTRYQLKRVLLVAIVLATIGLPLIRFEMNHNALPPAPVMDQVEWIIQSDTKPISASGITEIDLADTNSSKATFVWTWQKVLAGIYWLGVAVSLGILLYQLAQLLYLICFAEKRHDLGRLVISHGGIRFPFSFWKWTFLPPQFGYEKQTWQIVNEHELAHQEQAHSIDLIMVELLKCLLWFNPMAYWLQKSVKENHEFLADQTVLKTHSMEAYGQALLAVWLEAPSISISHSFSLKSNLHKRLLNMKNQRTSVVRSGMALSFFVAISLLVLSQVSLYAQQDDLELLDKRLGSIVTFDHDKSSANFNSYSVTLKTGASPDQWLILDKQIFPLIMPKKYKAMYEAYEEDAKTDIEGQLDYQMRVLMGSKRNSVEDDPYRHPLIKSQTLLTIELDPEEQMAMYKQSKEWTEKYIHQVYPDHELIPEMSFMENKYLFFVSFPSNIDPRKFGINNTVDISEVDQKPAPYGGMEHFLKNVIKLSEMDASIAKSDLPPKVEFEFIIDGGGNLVMLKPIAKVKGSKEVCDKIYTWIGQLNKNIIRVSEVYRWKPGRMESAIVPTRMRIEIPKRLL